jgi:preprotein translocase subunit SecD
MLYFTRLKSLLIVLVCALGVALAIPNLFTRPAAWIPWPQIHLGLDLRGGSYLLMQVDMQAVVKQDLTDLTDEVRSTLFKAHIGYTNLGANPASKQVSFTLLDPNDAPKAKTLLDKLITPVSAANGAPDLVVAIARSGAATLTLLAPRLDRQSQPSRRPIDHHHRSAHRWYRRR